MLNHTRFWERRGPDVLLEVPVSVPQAALGTKISVPTLDGEADLDIAAGTQSGDVVVLKGQGIARLDGNGKGDQIVAIRVEIPTKLSARVKEILRDLAEELGDDVHGPGLIERLKRSKRAGKGQSRGKA